MISNHNTMSTGPLTCCGATKVASPKGYDTASHAKRCGGNITGLQGIKPAVKPVRV